jgi:hypothetical protein
MTWRNCKLCLKKTTALRALSSLQAVTKNREPLAVVEKLTKDHDPSSFDCGKSSLMMGSADSPLHQQNDSARTYVPLARLSAITLSLGAVRSEESTARTRKKGLAKCPIGVIFIAAFLTSFAR